MLTMVLVPEHRHRDLGAGPPRGTLGGLALRPRRMVQRPVAVDLARARLGPARRRAALAQRRLLLLVQPRAARLDDRRIDDLPAHGEIARLVQMLVEAGEQLLDRPGLGQLLTEQPDRLGVRHLLGSPSPRKRMKDSRSWIWNSAWSSDRL